MLVFNVEAQPVEDDVNTGERQVRARKSVQRLIDNEDVHDEKRIEEERRQNGALAETVHTHFSSMGIK